MVKKHERNEQFSELPGPQYLKPNHTSEFTQADFEFLSQNRQEEQKRTFRRNSILDQKYPKGYPPINSTPIQPKIIEDDMDMYEM